MPKKIHVQAVINGQPDMQVVAQASNGHEAVECFGRHRPDITLMDLRLPDTNGIDSTIALRTHFPDARIIILTTFDCDGEIQRALASGAQSYLLKTMPPQEMVGVIRRVHAGRKVLDPRESRFGPRLPWIENAIFSTWPREIIIRSRRRKPATL